MAEDVYCTLLMSDTYLPGAAVLARSLRDSGTEKKLAVLITVDSLLAATIAHLKELFDYVIPVERIANPNLENLARLDRLDLRFAVTKIALWRQVQFRRLVYIDADVVALRAPDELFDINADFAAAPDIGWPDIFNTGVMMLKPNINEYSSMRTLASSGTSFDGADQGLLNEYYAGRPWHRLSFTYNCTPSSGYQYEPAYRYFRSSINMVHFIGKDKPWTQGRESLSSGSSGVYKELLGRWWATYDRHYSPQSSALGQVSPGVTTVQRYVKGEQRASTITWALPATPRGVHGHEEHRGSITWALPEARDSEMGPPEASAVTTEAPMTEPGEELERVDREAQQQGSAPAVEEPVFSPPQMDWDATRSEPPMESRPEAKNFPSQRYEMSHDPGLFRAPVSYPVPPRNIGYDIPNTKPAVYEKPKAIFPWEDTAAKPTRVFADDVPEPEPEAVPSTPPGSRASATDTSLTNSPATPIIQMASEDPWQSFSRANAWDQDATIERYVRSMKLAQQRRGQVQVIHQAEIPDTAAKDFATSDPSTPPRAKRRESLIITDFPTEVERPSLPVTPAPIHRQTFWGEERDAEGNLPPAEGVPEQVDWNPTERLEQLRRSSIITTAELPTAIQQASMPERDVPESSRAFESGASPPLSPRNMAAGVPMSLSSIQEVAGAAGTESGITFATAGTASHTGTVAAGQIPSPTTATETGSGLTFSNPSPFTAAPTIPTQHSSFTANKLDPSPAIVEPTRVFPEDLMSGGTSANLHQQRQPRNINTSRDDDDGGGPADEYAIA